MYKNSVYTSQKTLQLQCGNKLVNAVYGNNRCLL